MITENPAWIRFEERPPGECDGETVRVWHTYQGAMAVRREDAGKNRFFTHWMPIPEDGWIGTDERRPGKGDGDPFRCVLADHEAFGIRVTGIVQFDSDRRYTRWMRTPDEPIDQKTKEVRNNE